MSIGRLFDIFIPRKVRKLTFLRMKSLLFPHSIFFWIENLICLDVFFWKKASQIFWLDFFEVSFSWLKNPSWDPSPVGSQPLSVASKIFYSKKACREEKIRDIVEKQYSSIKRKAGKIPPLRVRLRRFFSCYEDFFHVVKVLSGLIFIIKLCRVQYSPSIKPNQRQKLCYILDN